MKNKTYFLNKARERLGKPPMVPRHSQKQAEYFERNKLIAFFRDMAREEHQTSYFTHPIDFKSAEKANSAIGKMIKEFFARCDNDLEKAKEVITWYLTSENYFRASENGYSPTVCFNIRTVVDFENKDTIIKKKPLAKPILSREEWNKQKDL